MNQLVNAVLSVQINGPSHGEWKEGEMEQFLSTLGASRLCLSRYTDAPATSLLT